MVYPFFFYYIEGGIYISNNLLPMDKELQLSNMKTYVHFVKKMRMSSLLSNIGFFRCSQYAKFLISNSNNIGTKPTQDMLFQLYDFDTKLRELLFHYCQIAELYFKTTLADSISLRVNDSAFYIKREYYTPSRSERNKVKKQSSIRYFNTFFKKLSNDLSKLTKTPKKYPKLKEYRKGGKNNTSIIPCGSLFNYLELGTIVNIYAYLRGDLRNYALIYGYSRSNYTKSSTKQFDTWLESLRNLRNICAHHNILISKTSSIVLPESLDSHTLLSNTDLFSRLYALKKILPPKEHVKLKHDLQILIKRTKINVINLNILPFGWDKKFDDIITF